MQMFLTVPRNARISVLSLAIWQAGVRPDSWAYQCEPDFYFGLRGATLERALYNAGYNAARRLEHDHALAREIERAREILASQGKVLSDEFYEASREIDADTPPVPESRL